MMSWVVFERDGELEAVEDHWVDIQYTNIHNNGGTILGYPTAKTKDDAINYIDRVVDWRK